MGNAEVVVTQIRKRAEDRRDAANRQPPKYRDFIEHCNSEAKWLDRVADTIEELQAECVRAWRNQ